MFKFLKNVWEESKIPQYPEDTPNTIERGVGEPVISFVKLLEEQPENFLWNMDRPKRWGVSGVLRYRLFDKKNRKMYRYGVMLGSSTDYLITYDISFLTRQERQYLLKIHWQRYNAWLKDTERELQVREEAQRQQYIDIYCKEQQ